MLVVQLLVLLLNLLKKFHFLNNQELVPLCLVKAAGGIQLNGKFWSISLETCHYIESV